MIQFETIDDFAEAVMEVIRARLTVGVDIITGSNYYDTTKKIEVVLADEQQYTNFAISTVELPLPEVKY